MVSIVKRGEKCGETACCLTCFGLSPRVLSMMHAYKQTAPNPKKRFTLDDSSYEKCKRSKRARKDFVCFHGATSHAVVSPSDSVRTVTSFVRSRELVPKTAAAPSLCGRQFSLAGCLALFVVSFILAVGGGCKGVSQDLDRAGREARKGKRKKRRKKSELVY